MFFACIKSICWDIFKLNRKRMCAMFDAIEYDACDLYDLKCELMQEKFEEMSEEDIERMQEEILKKEQLQDYYRQCM